MKLVLIYKDFKAAKPGVSHVGLGVTSQNAAKVLQREGINTEAFPVVCLEDVVRKLYNDKEITHVVIGAPWIPTKDLETIIAHFTWIKFACTSHSNIGFLAVEPAAIKLLRDYKLLQEKYPNFKVAGNSEKFVEAWSRMYGTNLAFLPNLYYIDDEVWPYFVGHEIENRPVRIGIFGSVRPLKNFVSAVAACIDISVRLNKNVEIFMSSGRDEGGATTIRAIDELVAGLPNVRLIKSMWSDHGAFKRLVREMDILMQPSYTESFNMVTADGASVGVPSVVSEAITWTPKSWQAPIDDVSKIAWVGLELLLHRWEEATRGVDCLEWYVERGIKQWLRWLDK
jgi:hypothetical protein